MRLQVLGKVSQVVAIGSLALAANLTEAKDSPARSIRP